MTSKPNTSKPITDSPDDEWDTVSEARSKFILNTVGDVWEAFFEGPDIVTDPNTGEEYEYLNFRSADGEPFMTSASFDLSRAFSTIPVGSYVRITLTSLIPKAKGNDLKLHKVQVRK